MEDRWIHAAEASEIPDAAPFPLVELAGQPIVLVRSPAGIHAIGAACPHLQSPMTSAEVAGSTVECIRHFYAYDLTTGRNTFPGDPTDEPLPIFEVREQGGQVWVRVGES